jgi:NAD(P)-dependent dehydrogenase (short-subunit alcohol dehydrogenase family)
MTAKDTQSTPTQRLSGKVAVITGGSSGIGYAIAQAFQVEACNVVITSRDQKRLSAALSKLSGTYIPDGGKFRGQVCEVRDAASVEALFDMVKTRFGRIDILVNNAGISQPPTPVELTSVEMWREMIDINLNGVFLCTRSALPMMDRGSTIVNNLSAAATQVFPNFAAYTAAKTGAYGFTRALRDELMPRGIRVTALMSGATWTDIWQQIMPDASRDGMMDVKSIAQAVLYAVLLPPEANLSEILITPTAGAVGAKNTGE